MSETPTKTILVAHGHWTRKREVSQKYSHLLKMVLEMAGTRLPQSVMGVHQGWKAEIEPLI